MTFRRSKELKRTKIEIIPMIDTMFFLLVFFMLSSLALTRLVGLPVNLPKASSSVSVQDTNLALTIDGTGGIFLDRTPVSFEALGDVIKNRVAQSPRKQDLVLVINADESSSHGLVVKCIDAARVAGVSRFAIATKVAGS